MSKLYVKDIRDKERVESIFMVGKKSLPTSKNGKPYLAFTVHDKTGEIDARVWENAAEVDQKFGKGDLVKLIAVTVMHQGRPQLKVESVERADLGELSAEEFAAPPRQPEAAHEAHGAGQQRFEQVVQLIDRLQDPHVRALLRSFVDDPEIAAPLCRAPAAKSIHHAYPGGLLEHTLSCMRLAHRLADHYPMADRDLLLAGAFLHDIGKIRELSFERGVEYTDEGRLVGHLVITAQWIHERARAIAGFPAELEHHLTHLVLGHHGELEYGSPKLPATIEALLVHALDELDSRMNSWLGLMAKDPGDRWTDYSKLYDRHLWKGPLPTASGKRPVDAPRPSKRRHKIAPVAAAETAPSEAGPARREVREPREPRADRREPRERRERAPKEEKLTFKPFAAIAAAEGEPEPTPSPAVQASPEPAPTPSSNGSAAPDSSEAN